MDSITVMEAQTKKETIELQIIEFLNQKFIELVDTTGLSIIDAEMDISKIETTNMEDRKRRFCVRISDFEIQTELLG